MSEHSTPSLFDRPEAPESAATNYALSFAALAAAVLLRYLLDPWMGTPCRSSRFSAQWPWP